MKPIVLLVVLGVPLAGCTRTAPAAEPPAADSSVVLMSPDAQKNAGLTRAPAEVSDLTDYLRVSGTVQPDDSRIGTVRSLARGRVDDVLVRVGDRVIAGQPLARVDNIEAGDLGAQLLSERAELHKLTVLDATAARQLERSRSLAAIGASSGRDLELADSEHTATAEAVRAQQSRLAGLEAKLRRLGAGDPADSSSPAITTIRAPFDGVVIRAQTAPGDIVDADVTLFAVTDLSEVWVQAEVYAKDLGRVRLGQTARVTVDTFPDTSFAGRVVHISDVLDPKTRTALVRCTVPNRDRRLRVDMLVAVDVPVTAARMALSVPAPAVQELMGRPVVFVPTGPDRFAIREVRVGDTVRGRTEILTGLVEREMVVAAGAHYLKSVRLRDQLEED